MSQQSRILAGVFCSGMAAALIAMAALQLPSWLQQRKMVSESPPVAVMMLQLWHIAMN